MNTSADLYSVAGESVAILRKRFLTLCDNNHCAAFLLDQFYAYIETRFMWASQGMHYDSDDYSTTIQQLVNNLFGLFTEEQVIDALNLLINKKYIALIEYTQETGYCTLAINMHEIDKDSDVYSNEQSALREKHETHLKAENPTPVYSSPVSQQYYELPLEQKHKTEMGRILYQNKRAEKLELPATLTLEQWISTLDHFERRCAYCKGDYRVLEHYIPLVHGKGTTQANCVPACNKCNSIKGTYHPLAMPEKAQEKMGEALQSIQQYLVKFEVEEDGE